MNVTSQDKILSLQQKGSAKEERIKMLNEAYQLYKSEKAKDSKIGWTDIAKRVKFLGADDKPNGHSLMMAIQREALKGRIDGWTKE